MATWIRTGRTSWRSVQLATGEAAPTNDGNQGVDLRHARSIMPSFRAEEGETFTGSGYWRGYVWIPSRGLWVRAPLTDDDASALSGLGEGALPAIIARFEATRFQYIPETVGVSGGTTVTIDYTCGLRTA
jgi:hypothetical protein